jgi:hypothetical protein
MAPTHATVEYVAYAVTSRNKRGLQKEVFSARSVPKCYKQDKSRVQLVVRQSQDSKGVIMEVEGSTAFEAVTRERLVKTEQTKNT